MKLIIIIIQDIHAVYSDICGNAREILGNKGSSLTETYKIKLIIVSTEIIKKTKTIYTFAKSENIIITYREYSAVELL